MQFGSTSVWHHIKGYLLPVAFVYFVSKQNVLITIGSLFLVWLQKINDCNSAILTTDKLIFTRLLNPFRRTIEFDVTSLKCLEYFPGGRYMYSTASLQITYEGGEKWIYIDTATIKVKLLLDTLMEKGIRVIYPLYAFQ